MTKKISDFTPQKRNANKHTPYGLRLLEKSLREDGFIDAQTAAADGEIISGSARLEKAVEVFTDEDGQEVEPIIVHSDGKRPVIVIRDDIPNAEHPRARRLSVAANKIAQVDFDPDWALLKEWGGEDEQIKKLFSDDEWREGTGDEAPQVDAEPQIDRAAELQEKWQTASGQLWQLGKHRLLIGDCTVRENVERLMGGERADMVWIDPPYGVSYKSSNGNTIQNDELVGGDLQNFLSKSFNLFFQYSQVDAAWYIWHASKYQREFENALNENKISVLQQCIWVKGEGREGSSGVNAPAIGRADWRWLHEPCFYASAGNPFNLGDRTTTTVWTVTRDTTGRIHPTEKPIGVAEIPIKNSSTKNNIVLDGFCGSGTTIIAAQNLSRRCFAMEISEKYGAVILERFYTATGITPELEDK